MATWNGHVVSEADSRLLVDGVICLEVRAAEERSGAPMIASPAFLNEFLPGKIPAKTPSSDHIVL
jgi:hypothetical protein